MEQRVLGEGLRVSAVGLGCMGLSHAYGAPVDEVRAIDFIRQAYETGYRFFDTAEVYGTETDPHHNERVVGEALRDVRDQVVIATKCGLAFGPVVDGTFSLVSDARHEAIRASVEGSLARLQTDHIDLYYLHRVDPKVSVEDVAATMGELVDEGKILHWGLSEVSEDQIRRAHAVRPLAAVQNRYSMMARWHESVFGALEELGIGLVAFSPMANGLLTGAFDARSTFDQPGDYRRVMPQFKPGAYDANRDLLQLVGDVAREKGATMAQVSLAWMLCKKPYIVPIPGTRNVDRMRENAGAAEVRLTSAEVATIDAALDAMEMSDVFGGSKLAR